MNQYMSFNSDSKPGHLLHRLYALQQQCLYISPESIHQVATEFNLPVSQISAVVAFYAFFYDFLFVEIPDTMLALLNFMGVMR